MFDHDIPSLSASLEAFDPERSIHSAYSTRSPMHSSRWSGEESEAESEGPWAPPAWQKSNTGWYRKSLDSGSALRSSPSKSKGASPQHDFQLDRDLTPSHIPLPESPMKQTPRTSPEPISEQERHKQTPELETLKSHGSHYPPTEQPAPAPEQDVGEEELQGAAHTEPPVNLDRFLRFAVRAEILLRAAPIDAAISSFNNAITTITTSRIRSCFTLLVVFLAWLVFQPWDRGLVPDLANAASLAKGFEPLIFLSENVIPRSRELGESSIAVWDLGESVRATNMSSSPQIIAQLNDLSDSLRVLSEKLTSFFTNVDGDIDSILLTMEWAKRELEALQGPSTGRLSTALGNVHSALCTVGFLERHGEPTAIGKAVANTFGQTFQQRSKSTLQRTFTQLVTVLEENISSELGRAAELFMIFETVERQFQNLQRMVAREEDQMSTQKDEFLASLWRKSLGNQLKLKKYEKNLKLLSSVRASVLDNMIELQAHNRVITSLREQLDGVRKKLVSPLIQSAHSNSFGLEHQLQGLAGTHDFLKGLRDKQKHKVLQKLWGGPKKRVSITTGREEGESG